MVLKQMKFLPWDLSYSDSRENGCFCKVQYFPEVRCMCSKLFINRFKNYIDLSIYLYKRHWKMVSISLHEQLSSHWMEFCEILYWEFFWKCVKQIQVMLKSDKNNKHCTWSPAYLYVTGLNHGDRQYSVLSMSWGQRNSNLNVTAEHDWLTNL
jgi:hypothetical protein